MCIIICFCDTNVIQKQGQAECSMHGYTGRTRMIIICWYDHISGMIISGSKVMLFVCMPSAKSESYLFGMIP